MAMVIPRSRSSGALSIEPKVRYSPPPFSARYLVIAAVRLVLPWSMWPMVPILTWGLLRSNFFLAIVSLRSLGPRARHRRVGVRGVAGDGAHIGTRTQDLFLTK